MRAMLWQASSLFVLLSVTALPAQTLEKSLPISLHKRSIVLGACREIKTDSQRRRTPITTEPTATLEEHPILAPAETQNSERGTTFHRRRKCPNGFLCLQGRCRKIIKASCRDGYAMIRGRCRKMETLGQRNNMLKTAAPGPTLEDSTTTSDATTSVPTTTLLYFPNRCRDGYVMVRGQCRRMWTPGQLSRMTKTTEPIPTVDPFLEPTTTQSPQPTIGYPRERCRDGFVLVRGRCRKLINVRQARSADSQRTTVLERGVEPAVSTIQDSEATLRQRKPAGKTVCPEGSKYKFGMCLTPVFVRLVTLPKHY